MITIGVPCTTANIGPGYDCLGIALNLFNTFKCKPANKDIVEIYGYGSEVLPNNADNLVFRTMEKVYERIGKERPPIHLILENNIPTSRGLGSSASAIVAGIILANHLTGDILDDEEMIKMAVEMEGHPDNVVPAFLGHAVISCIDNGFVHHTKFEIKKGLNFIACIPDIETKTEESRSILPKSLNREDVVFNSSRVALLVYSLMSGDYSKLNIAVEDKIHQPYRLNKIPGSYKVIEDAKAQGALGVFLSGSGPTIMALSMENPKKIGEAMVDAFKTHNIKSSYIVLTPVEGII